MNERDIFPVLPPRQLDKNDTWIMDSVRGTEWETCWEYVLTHQLTDTEGAAFWNGARLAMEAATAATEALPAGQEAER